MQYSLTEIVNTVPWNEGITNAPADLVTKAKQMAERGEPVILGKITTDADQPWVILGIEPTVQKLYIVARAHS